MHLPGSNFYLSSSALEKLRENSCASLQFNGYAKLYLEHVNPPVDPVEIESDDLLIFLKYFDVQQQRLR
jgi:ubiquitin carboxyl-terminal hydrolase 7